MVNQDQELLFKYQLIKIEQKKFEVYIAKNELLGIYLKRFFPKYLHKLVVKSKVR